MIDKLASKINSTRKLRLTLFGRSLLLVICELLANAICWIVCASLFSKTAGSRPILSLALLAWTIGLRHALDADHISAIDNATRGLISLGQLPVTCGLFFSLGHSTVVIAVNVAIAISTSVYEKMNGVGQVGGIVGSAVSASFLFIVGLANSIILWKIIRRRRAEKASRKREIEHGATVSDPETHVKVNDNMLMMRILGPVVKFVNLPWKMYPVGLLFGFGFDTASSIALLAVSGIAKRSADGAAIRPGDIVILPLLFTAGMSLVDSLDSVLMVYSYSDFSEHSLALFRGHGTVENPADATPAIDVEKTDVEGQQKQDPDDSEAHPSNEAAQLRTDDIMELKHNTMSTLSIVLTLMSILVAFSISLITTMGLIGDNCHQCQSAANADGGGGLAGRWWRGWAKANDNSGYIGAGIVGCFLLVVSLWYGHRFAQRKVQEWKEKGGAR
ncbi:NicO-domain-containing protein [Neolentinus lepideus HHB14362 ss-1]|uniref:Nickel/cobalt efflux system n=1 Tax=Neolentinus lepideus HHB14362 ss-1 TaxID=1314782 RepID=A0A165MKA1_9AGAM|nr:NicO-domain-containing protein [Neolentinus lepideus HHB14362 ss-1]